jgi:hypothetical protein
MFGGGDVGDVSGTFDIVALDRTIAVGEHRGNRTSAKLLVCAGPFDY